MRRGYLNSRGELKLKALCAMLLSKWLTRRMFPPELKSSGPFHWWNQTGRYGSSSEVSTCIAKLCGRRGCIDREETPSVQRLSQRAALSVFASDPELDPFLRYIIYAYISSLTRLQRIIFILAHKELKLPEGTVLEFVKPLYGIPERVCTDIQHTSPNTLTIMEWRDPR